MKRLILIISILNISAILLAESSHAQSRGGSSGQTIYFEETFFPKYVNKRDTTSSYSAPGTAPEAGLGIDARTTFGYMFFNQSFLFGLTFNAYSLSTKQENVVGGHPGRKETTSENQFGPTIGWLNGGFRTLLTFFVSGTKEVDTTDFNETGDTGHGNITNSGLKGYQLTVGYTFAMWGVEIGPTLAYTSIAYSKQKNVNKLTSTVDFNGTLYQDAIDTELSPMLSIIARF